MMMFMCITTTPRQHLKQKIMKKLSKTEFELNKSVA